jgi:hypothetical protein
MNRTILEKTLSEKGSTSAKVDLCEHSIGLLVHILMSSIKSVRYFSGYSTFMLETKKAQVGGLAAKTFSLLLKSYK